MYFRIPPFGLTFHDKACTFHANYLVYLDMEVSASVFRTILYAARSKGADVAGLCKKVGIEPSELDNSEKRFSLSAVDALFKHSIHLTNDSLFGLHIGEQADFSAFGIVGFVMKTSPDVITALERACHYNNLASGLIKVSFTKNEDEGIFRTTPLPLVSKNHPITAKNGAEHAISFILRAIQKLSGKKILPRSTDFTFPTQRENLEEYRRIFTKGLRFNQAENDLIYKLKDLETPVVGYNRDLFELLNTQAQEILDGLSKGESFAKKVRRVIVKKFNHQFPTIDLVADELNLSIRSLQRKLTLEGETFQNILDAIRQEFAVQYLKNKELSISEVGYLLGFSEPSVFSRSFKRWMGHSPKEYLLSL